MKTVEAVDLKQLLSNVFDRAREGLREELVKKGRADVYERLKRDFVFHMTDWSHDLGRLYVFDEDKKQFVVFGE